MIISRVCVGDRLGVGDQNQVTFLLNFFNQWAGFPSYCFVVRSMCLVYKHKDYANTILTIIPDTKALIITQLLSSCLAKYFAIPQEVL